MDNRATARPLGLTESVVPLRVSRQKTSPPTVRSFMTRFLAWLKNATYWPSLLMAGDDETPFPLVAPSALTVTSVIAPVCKSRRKISSVLLVLFAVRSFALLTKAM